ncbi:MAG: DEAD/DEAH box helicase family protein [Bradyrhizobium sp.]|uniref:DEAD/DEAH box helicase family protein n=1 Tax=Bradyrhizobium sp. TaxID=376 RepID=UPI002715CD40|nr:DEAD/DEAH box helicase family protein [Bradyrhizobium sp.]MDO8397952.1 DEAD/DEAH box helicase family protein [Bradyrhizobium sp.]
MSNVKLAEFQSAAVETICERLTDTGGSRRFLLADEVGLGKTVVARGVIEELMRRRRGRDLTVVYLCSNSEIADQNRTKLAPNAPPSLRRITQLAWSAKKTDDLQLYSFTPGTSLTEGTGLAWERQLLLFLTYRVLRQDIRKGKWREYFRCGAGEERWKATTRFSVLRLEFNRKLRSGLQQRIAEEWRKPIEVEGSTLVLSDVLRNEVDQFQPNDAGSRKRRNRIVGILRSAAQRILLDDLQPHLVILDEVQRFREVIEEAGSKKSIAARLFDRRPGVLILSATPYRMLALDHEGQGHYDEFLDTVRFLFADQGKQEVARLRGDLKAFRERLEVGAFLQGNDPELLALRARIEKRLRKVICRTERNAYIQDPTKGIQEIRPTGDAFAVPQKEEVVDYIRLRRFLLDKVDTSQHITEYWKSCPAPFTFMDAQYAPMTAAKRKKAIVPLGVVEPPSKLGGLARRNLRFRELFRAVFGTPGTQWKFLWTRPTYTYYRDEFFQDADPTKMLIFSGWRFVPKAIALLTSHEAEQRIAPRGRLWDGDDRPPLRFTEKGSFHIFDVCLPSPALARLIEPSAIAGDDLTAKDLLRRTRKSLKQALIEAGVEVATTSRSPIWQVVARLEQRSGSSIRRALEKSIAYNGDDMTERFAEHVDTFASWMGEQGTLRISEERLTHLARIAAFSPAVSLLRAFWTTFPDNAGEVHEKLIDLCFGELRSYFNRRTVRAIVERTAQARRGYARGAIDYCERAHFQAVADEYLYVGKNVLQRNTQGEMAEHLARVLGVGTGSPKINLTTDTGRLRTEQLVRRSHFALAFGEDVKADQGSPLEQSGPSRKTAVREAFNSPFWPFVLSTTSVGQEGLDFHLFCRDIVHWNLPSNPVDLEQREGRINRRDGLAVRRAAGRQAVRSTDRHESEITVTVHSIEASRVRTSPSQLSALSP